MTDADPTAPAPDAASAAATGRSTAVHPVGLAEGTRFRCEGCGNLTRFDVEVTERARRYWHVTVGGVGTVEETQTHEQVVESVTCRWCGSSDRIVTEAATAPTHPA